MYLVRRLPIATMVFFFFLRDVFLAFLALLSA
jgi:hypothetical protein